MATGQLSIDFHPANLPADKDIDISDSSTTLRILSKTSDEFLDNGNYTAPKYATCTSGTMSCKAKKTLAGSEKPLYLKINGKEIGHVDIARIIRMFQEFSLHKLLQIFRP